jgi:hypothetical protein
VRGGIYPILRRGGRVHWSPTDWHESKAEIFHQVQYSELATFHELAE